MVRTINELSQLGCSDFNQPPPRHGLNLLYWFAKNINQLDPTTSMFGFHRFYNRIEDDDDKLLPDKSLLHYEVGNLNAPRADKLPQYVRPKNRQYHNQSNMDRIIVGVSHRSIERVYVTEHVDQINFNMNRTYRVSKGLLGQIRGLEREEFLKRMEQQRVNVPKGTGTLVAMQQSNRILNDHSNHQQSETSLSWCTIL